MTRRSLDDGSAATLVHAFVTSRVDYCNAIYAGAPKTVTDKLQRVLNAAARVVSDTRKFDRGLSTLLHDELYGRRAFPVAGPTVWNSLPDELRDPACDDSFKQFFKTILFSSY